MLLGARLNCGWTWVVRHQDPGICPTGPSGNTVGLNDNKLYEIPDVPNPTPRKDWNRHCRPASLGERETERLRREWGKGHLEKGGIYKIKIPLVKEINKQKKTHKHVNLKLWLYSTPNLSISLCQHKLGSIDISNLEDNQFHACMPEAQCIGWVRIGLQFRALHDTHRSSLTRMLFYSIYMSARLYFIQRTSRTRSRKSQEKTIWAKKINKIKIKSEK